MTRKELDQYICEKLLGMQACDGWRPVWYRNNKEHTSMTGSAILKHCDHPEDTCYSRLEVNTFLGRLGGPPQYCGSSRAALVLLKRLEKFADIILVYWTLAGGWSAELRSGDRVLVGPTRALVPEMAIALAAAELTGLKVTAEDVES